MIDLHSHILPGIDDGSRTLEEAVDLGRSAAEDGITVIAATPHVRDDYPTTPDQMERGVDEVNAALAAAGVEVEVRRGGEIALDRLASLSAEEVRRFGLGGNASYLLVEFPYYGWPLDLAEQLFRLRASGITPVLAHPERNADVQANPERLRSVVEAGALVQLTAASIDGRIGRSSRECGFRLLELGLAHVLASDAHHPGIRAVGMAAAVEAIDDEALGRWLAHDVPAALLANETLPERPAAERRRRGWLNRLRG